VLLLSPKLQRFEEAAQAFSRIAELDPAGDALYQQGRLLARAGKYEEALNAFDSMLEHNPGFIEAQKFRGHCACQVRSY